MQVLSDSQDSISVRCLDGVGVRIAERLEKLGIVHVTDLLFHLPSRYEDRTRVCRISELIPGTQVLVQGVLQSVNVVPGRRRSLICVLSDGSGVLSLRFFHFSSSWSRTLRCGESLRCFGEVRDGFSGLELIHPEFEKSSCESTLSENAFLTAVYPLTQGLRQGLIRRLVSQAFDRCSQEIGGRVLHEWMPASLLQELRLPLLADALRTLHYPPADSDLHTLECCASPAQRRLILEELVAHALCLQGCRRDVKIHSAPVFNQPGELIDRFISQLGFSLTAAQYRVLSEIEQDFLCATPMMRLIHGDVGSGKTVVAALAALHALASGYQVALMAPTEILAEQHYRSFLSWFSAFGFEVALLTGSLSAQERQEIQQRIREGACNFVVGTHALFQDSVAYSRLGLVIIDEQHRFGVQQRLQLREKGRQDRFCPHQLIMTATPIPRTLAMLQYADLDVSVLDELPSGRIPVQTTVLPAGRRSRVIERVGEWIRNRRQVYWVCTLIDESDSVQYEAVENTSRVLSETLPGARISVIHGKLKSTEKERVMNAFLAHETDLLVATTVIEVGVNVPNADLMVVENPERLGLAQLHQLRGRVGRGSGEAFCVLMYQAPLSDLARERLAIMRETSDGFRIAEKDLELRGPGELLGTQQTGQFRFRITDLVRDKSMIERALQVAETLQRNFPQSVEPLVARWVGDSSRYSEV